MHVHGAIPTDQESVLQQAAAVAAARRGMESRDIHGPAASIAAVVRGAATPDALPLAKSLHVLPLQAHLLTFAVLLLH